MYECANHRRSNGCTAWSKNVTSLGVTKAVRTPESGLVSRIFIFLLFSYSLSRIIIHYALSSRPYSIPIPILCYPIHQAIFPPLAHTQSGSSALKLNPRRSRIRSLPEARNPCFNPSHKRLPFHNAENLTTTLSRLCTNFC